MELMDKLNGVDSFYLSLLARVFLSCLFIRPYSFVVPTTLTARLARWLNRGLARIIPFPFKLSSETKHSDFCSALNSFNLGRRSCHIAYTPYIIPCMLVITSRAGGYLPMLPASCLFIRQ